MARGPRLPAIAPGIYPDRFGYEVRVPGFPRAKAKRFPPCDPADRAKHLQAMQTWQADQVAYERRCRLDDASTPTITRGTFSADADRYLATRKGRTGYKADRSHLKAWVARFGSKPRHRVTTHDCEKQIAAWLAAKRSPKTIKHRVRVLKELWHHADGPRARTPVDGLKLPRIPKTAPTPVPEAIILKVADSLLQGKRHTKARKDHGEGTGKGYGGDSDKARARFLVYALTGQRPSQIGRAKPEHIDRERRIWWVQPAKGGHPTAFPLIEELDLAFQLFAKAKAWGPFDTRSFSKTIKRHGWPADIRPYTLRHNFAIKQLLAGTDLGDLQGLLGHTNPTTTRIYAPVLVARLREAVQRGSTLTLVKTG